MIDNEDNKFKKGDNVRIAETSYYYKHSSDSNPRDVTGVIHRIIGSTIIVNWGGGITNGYDTYDLVKVSQYIEQDGEYEE